MMITGGHVNFVVAATKTMNLPSVKFSTGCREEKAVMGAVSESYGMTPDF